MTDYTVKLEWEQVDSILKQELRGALETLKEDLQKNYEDGNANVFDTDPVKDRAMIREHIHSFDLVVKYMCGNY